MAGVEESKVGFLDYSLGSEALRRETAGGDQLANTLRGNSESAGGFTHTYGHDTILATSQG